MDLMWIKLQVSSAKISLDFSQLWKMMPALAFNFMIATTNAWRGKWNRHAVAPSDNFLHLCYFFNFCKKMPTNENGLCPLHYEEVLEAIISAVWTEQFVGISMNWDTRGRLPRVKPGWSFVCQHYASSWGRTEGKNGSFLAIRMNIHQNFSSSMTPLWT